MASIENTAMKITQAFEDDYFNKERREMYNVIFTRYLSMVEFEGPDPYEAIISLGRSYPYEFGQMVRAFEDQGLIPRDPA